MQVHMLTLQVQPEHLHDYEINTLRQTSFDSDLGYQAYPRMPNARSRWPSILALPH